MKKLNSKSVSLVTKEPLSGIVKVSSDKSISHRSLIIGSMAIGETSIDNLLESEDTFRTIEALRLLGVNINKSNSGKWLIQGVGTGGFSEPNNIINFGNSGTSARLIMGAVSTCPISIMATGDESLNKRPMKRIIEPLSFFGAQFLSRGEGFLPIRLKGAKEPTPINYKSMVPSAQIKSAILLGALNSPGETTFVEPIKSRDHSEKMLKDFGAKIVTKSTKNGNQIKILGNSDLKAKKIKIPGDPSSASFLIAAAILVEGSDIIIEDILQNPTRNGFVKTLIEMGAKISFLKEEKVSGESVVNLRIEHSKLKGITVPSERVVSMIDEFPILSILASVAEGETHMSGLAELKVKESDRIGVMRKGLESCGVKVISGDDFLIIEGKKKKEIYGDVLIETFFDHRIAMSFLCLSLISSTPILIDDCSSIDTSFPNFFKLMKDLGAEEIFS